MAFCDQQSDEKKRGECVDVDGTRTNMYMFETQGGNCHEIAHYMIMMNCTLNVTCVPVK